MKPFRTLFLLALGGGLCGVVACTTFNGLSVDAGPPAAKKDSGPGDDDDDDMPDATTADAARDSGSDAEAEAAAPTAYLTIPAAAQMCLRFETCPFLSNSVQDSMGIPVLGTETYNFSACVDALAGPLLANRPGVALQSLVLGCVATATSCTAAKACLSYEDLDDNDPRCSFQPDAEVCEGTDQVVCDGDAIFHCTNAAYVGSECLDIPGDAGGVECVKDDSCPAFPSCSSPTVDDYCTDIGGHAQFDCSIYGDYCETFTDDGGPNADCFQGPGEEQNEDCGDDKVSCDAKGRVSICAGDVGIVYDCNALGETCVTGLTSVSCVPPDSECNPSSTGINVCTGDMLSVCVGGVKSMIDCSQLGATCVSRAVGLNSYCGPITDGGKTDAD